MNNYEVTLEVRRPGRDIPGRPRIFRVFAAFGTAEAVARRLAEREGWEVLKHVETRRAAG